MSEKRSNTQYLALQQRSAQTQNALDQLHENLQHMEDDLSQFLDEYYQQIGSDFEQLSALQEQLHMVSSRCFNVPSATAAATSQPTAFRKTNLKRDMQGFYHSLAREVHPDANSLKAELMSSLNAAYARKSLSEMWKVKWQLEQQKADGQLSHKQRLELLQKQHEQMQRALDDMQSREHEIKESAAFQLMQHAHLMRLCGQDFMAMVKGRVRAQITETKQKLVTSRIKARYWQHVKSEPANSNPTAAPSRTRIKSA